MKFHVSNSFEDVVFGELEIEEWRQFVIVDYQHRWRGLRYAIDVLGAEQLRNFAVPVTLIAELPRVGLGASQVFDWSADTQSVEA